ncbi:AraC family transcriptional regulator [Sessilibacter corallicola]|uniref:AraC family transcriptional regulator n=1 Tax=Sessilibacter corallicola TaxID=2904075 RepID=A0ABQ0AC67_9GAMM
MTNLVNLLEKLANEEGYNQTRLDGVGVYKASESSSRVPLCYSQGLIVVAQGQKQVFLDEQVYHYNPDNYLVLTLPLPAECETIVTPGQPLYCMMIDFDMGQLTELVRLFDEHHQSSLYHSCKETKGLYASECNAEFNQAILRLAECLQSPLKSDVLGKGLVREVLYILLQGPLAASLFALVSHNTQLSRLERVLKYLHENYQEQLDVDQLADMANMSTSSFHRNFKQMTASSPIQYVKKMRLNRAKELLLDQGLKVKQAAAQVGYESPTQFSREFKRYFGESPQMIGRA